MAIIFVQHVRVMPVMIGVVANMLVEETTVEGRMNTEFLLVGNATILGSGVLQSIGPKKAVNSNTTSSWRAYSGSSTIDPRSCQSVFLPILQYVEASNTSVKKRRPIEFKSQYVCVTPTKIMSVED